jgi:hypothetical protein
LTHFKIIIYPTALLLSSSLAPAPNGGGQTLVRSVRYSAFAKFSFDFDVSAIRAVGEKKTTTAA